MKIALSLFLILGSLSTVAQADLMPAEGSALNIAAVMQHVGGKLLDSRDVLTRITRVETLDSIGSRIVVVLDERKGFNPEVCKVIRTYKVLRSTSSDYKTNYLVNETSAEQAECRKLSN